LANVYIHISAAFGHTQARYMFKMVSSGVGAAFKPVVHKYSVVYYPTCHSQNKQFKYAIINCGLEFNAASMNSRTVFQTWSLYI